MKKLFTLFFILLGLAATAQVPGYLGMRNSFGYEPNVSVAFQFMNSDFHASSLFLYPKGFGGKYKDQQLRPFALNLTHTFVYDRIIKRNASMVFTLSFYNSGVYLDSVYTGTFNTATSSFDYATCKGGNTKLSGYAGSICYRRYRNDLAPIGLYAGYFMGFATTSALVRYDAADSTLLTGIKITNSKFGYMYGRQNVFFDRVIVDRGFTFDVLGLLIGIIKNNRAPKNFNTNSGITDPIESFTRQLKIRMYYRDFLTFYVGGKLMF